MIKAIWLPFMVYKSILTGKNEESYTVSISKYFDKIAEQGLNRVFVHVRPFGDALYKSNVFPSSFLITGYEGERMKFDPLEIMTKKARERNLSIEAWVNPFRVRSVYIETGDISLNNPVINYLESGDAIEYQGGIIYNPASERVRDLILNGLIELCSGYDIDGIHFDDYFYPSSDPYFDMDSYAAYKAPGGGLSQATWRRVNVSLLLKKCYEGIHSVRNNLVFGVSPKGYLDCNINEEFFDVPDVLSKNAYLDYICPQAYFAVRDEVYSFEDCIRTFDLLIKANITLVAGLPAYKIGHPEPHSGIGENDWLYEKNLLAKMVDIACKYKNFNGYSLYEYTSVFEPKNTLAARMKDELRALKQNSSF